MSERFKPSLGDIGLRTRIRVEEWRLGRATKWGPEEIARRERIRNLRGRLTTHLPARGHLGDFFHFPKHKK